MVGFFMFLSGFTVSMGGVLVGRRWRASEELPSATCRYCQKDHNKMQHERLLKEYPE